MIKHEILFYSTISIFILEIIIKEYIVLIGKPKRDNEEEAEGKSYKRPRLGEKKPSEEETEPEPSQSPQAGPSQSEAEEELYQSDLYTDDLSDPSSLSEFASTKPAPRPKLAFQRIITPPTVTFPAEKFHTGLHPDEQYESHTDTESVPDSKATTDPDSDPEASSFIVYFPEWFKYAIYAWKWISRGSQPSPPC